MDTVVKPTSILGLRRFAPSMCCCIHQFEPDAGMRPKILAFALGRRNASKKYCRLIS